MSTKRLTRKELADYIKWLENNLHKSVFQVSGFLQSDIYKSWVGNIEFEDGKVCKPIVNIQEEASQNA